LPADVEGGDAARKATRGIRHHVNDGVVAAHHVSRQIVAVFRSNGSGGVEDGGNVDPGQVDRFERSMHDPPFEEMLDRSDAVGVDTDAGLIAR
jgi:hypothetical protein